jgi:co-chaperonin GroES (HSP10)
MFRPIRNRVLVRPDAPEAESAGGILIPEKAQDTIAMSGEVIALGPECKGPSYRIRADVLADVEHCIERVAGRVVSHDWPEELRTELRALLCGYFDVSQDVTIGAQVCFPYTAGTDIGADGERLILVSENDLAATWQANETRVEVAA